MELYAFKWSGTDDVIAVYSSQIEAQVHLTNFRLEGGYDETDVEVVPLKVWDTAPEIVRYFYVNTWDMSISEMTSLTRDPDELFKNAYTFRTKDEAEAAIPALTILAAEGKDIDAWYAGESRALRLEFNRRKDELLLAEDARAHF